MAVLSAGITVLSAGTTWAPTHCILKNATKMTITFFMLLCLRVKYKVNTKRAALLAALFITGVKVY
jgi:hypothetical protein